MAGPNACQDNKTAQIAYRSGPLGIKFCPMRKINVSIPMGTCVSVARRPSLGVHKNDKYPPIYERKIKDLSNIPSTLTSQCPPPIYDVLGLPKLGYVIAIALQPSIPTYLPRHMHRPVPQIGKLRVNIACWIALVRMSLRAAKPRK